MTTSATVPGKVYQALTDVLVDLGTRAVFGLVGADTVGFVTDVAGRGGIRYFGSRHENTAVGMADGYSWATGEVGFCTVTRGAGLLNSALAARTASRSHRRVVIVTGDVEVEGGDWEYDYKSLHHGPLAGALGLAYFAPREAGQVVQGFQEAIAAANGGHTALLSIPSDVLNGPIPEPGAPTAVGQPEALQSRELPLPTTEQLREIVHLIDHSSRPLIVAGRGAVAPAARLALEALAERTGALLGTTLPARELFRGNPYNLGIVGGYASDPAIPLLAQVDLALVFGASLTPWTTAGRTLFGGGKIPVVHVDTDTAKVGANFPTRIPVAADAGETARRLLDLLPVRENPKPFHLPGVLAALRQPLYLGADESTTDELDPRTVAVVLDELLPEDRVVVLDAGRHTTSAARFLRVPGRDYFRLTVDAGGIGQGLGIALGAQLGRPQLPTVLFVGDGGMSMTMQELETVVRHDVPLTVIVMNDRAYGAELTHCAARGLPLDCAKLPEINFAAVAHSLGMEAATVRTVEQLRSHGARLSQPRAPLLLDCRIRQDLPVRRVRWE
jgi:acetolactate synthase-1/2/3 large subunit